MHTRQLGNSDLHVTPIGFGAWAIGGVGWGPQDDNQSISAIHQALDLGINWIDTAAVYGYGHSEELIGRAMKGRAHQPYVFTKCSLVWREDGHVYNNLKAASIRAEIEASLRRLQRDSVDLYQIHWPHPDDDIEEGWSTLAQLQQEGKVRNIGVSNFSVAQMQRALAITPITSLQSPYSLLRREIESEILPFCEQNNIGVIVYSPMQSGLLSGAMTRERVASFAADEVRRSKPEFQEPNLTRALRLVETLRSIGERHGRTAGEIAISWTLRHPAVTGAIVGLRGPEQAEGIIGAGTFRLSEAEVAEIEALATGPDA